MANGFLKTLSFTEEAGQRVFSPCGVFLELTHFLAEKPELWQNRSFQQLASLIETVLAGPVDELYGAVEICFLDTVGEHEALADALLPYLQRRSRRVFELDTF
ncbi:hypothetical protein MF271_16935 [Deinococcus sp. KNUC1210]|uniref:hypothetical protein n=1 Tax=Deinococcus sp. KNUC1210 TaxID=2917691 RepID=UPI001EF04872|nr:hypothetical protein [Deinococcus sp. KNUC1210]ULH15572.1 hypothetical protein MF271_16935 [Deinococcus sp. KNUC1210]